MIFRCDMTINGIKAIVALKMLIIKTGSTALLFSEIFLNTS